MCGVCGREGGQVGKQEEPGQDAPNVTTAPSASFPRELWGCASGLGLDVTVTLGLEEEHSQTMLEMGRKCPAHSGAGQRTVQMHEAEALGREDPGMN